MQLVLVLLNYSISVHEVKDRSAVLIERCGFYLREECSNVLWIDRQELVCFSIELNLQFLYFT